MVSTSSCAQPVCGRVAGAWGQDKGPLPHHPAEGELSFTYYCHTDVGRLCFHSYKLTRCFSSLEPRLSVPGFVSRLSPKLQDKIRNGKPGFEASVSIASPHSFVVLTTSFILSRLFLASLSTIAPLILPALP